MANSDLMQFNVTGLDELARNLAEFGSPKMLGKIIGKSMTAGAQIPLARARINARGLGLGFRGWKRRNAEGLHSRGLSFRYGRIPLSLKANRVYVPKGSGVTDEYRLNIVARGQRWPGMYRNKAPHAHFIEYGFRHVGSGRHIGPRPFMGPALDSTASQVVSTIAGRMNGLIDGLKFPTTGKGP